jgi:hypothetical protein
MSLPSAPAAPTRMTSRFFLLGFLPVYAASIFLLVLAWADGGRGTSFKRAWLVASKLTAAQIALIVLLVLLLTLLLSPFQLPLVRVLEGAWPRRLGGGWSTARQLRRKEALAEAAKPTSTDEAEAWRAGRAGYDLRMRYPFPDHLVRSTRLGNILAAMEDRAGRDYGLDAVVAWPRLYPALNSATKAIVDERRNMLDLLARLSVTGAMTAVGALVILRHAGWWMAVALIPAAIAVLANQGMLRAALAYSESVQAAFDTHHLTFGAAFGLKHPKSPEAERLAYGELCDLWRQGIPPAYQYAAEPPKLPDTSVKP